MTGTDVDFCSTFKLIGYEDMDKYINPNQTIIRELKSEFKLNETNIVLGHVGSFSINKNQTFLIDIMNLLVKQKVLLLNV